MNTSDVKAAVYLRISQDPKQDGLAVERQRAECLNIAETRGWTVSEVYSDTVSASKRNVDRPDYERMVQDFKAGRFSALVCWDLDRLTRQPRQLEDWIEAAEDTGLLIVTANGEADLSQDNGRMFARIKASVARGEIEAKSRRQKFKNEQRIERGEPVPGRRRFGYESDNRTPREAEAVKVRWAFESVASGSSVRSVAIALGMRPVRVREWLFNESYSGKVKHKGSYYPSTAITPLVSEDLAALVRAILNDPTRKTSPGSEVKHLLSGIATCGQCGASMHYMNGYKCSLSASHVHIKKEIVEEVVALEVFMWVVEHPDAELKDGGSVALPGLLAELVEVNRKRAVTQELALMDGADLDAVRKTLGSLGKESERLEREVEAERALSVRSSIVEAVRAGWWERRDVREFTEVEQAAIDAWPAFWEAVPFEQRRETVRSLLNVRVEKGRGAERVKVTWKA